MKTLTIGKVARGAGVGVETVRFYEREGLIEKPLRKDSGYRQYSEETTTRILFIRRAKELGFTLKEINELLSLRLDPGKGCGDVKIRALEKITDLGTRIRTLQRMKKTLTKLTKACDGHASVNECPILDALDKPVRKQ